MDLNFTKASDQVNIHRPTGVKELNRKTVNLRFLASLGKDWNTYFINNGGTAKKQKTSELFAQIRALDENRSKDIDQTNLQNASSAPQNSQTQAYSTQFDFTRGGFRGRGRGGFRDRGGFRGRSRGKGGRRKWSQE